VNRLLSALALAALILPAGAAAQTAAAPQARSAAPDPARLAAARPVVARLLPPGTYKRMMDQSFGQIMDTVMESMGTMPLQDVVRLSGISEADAAELGQATIEQVMAIYDPHWKERTKLGTNAMMASITDLMSSMEPAMRNGLTRAYAREFSAAELGEMERFFATPAGAHYAEKSMAMFTDPELMKAMTDLMPEMMKRMPDMIAKAESATAHLPKQRGNKDLAPAEREQLGKLLGVAPAELETEPAADDAT
jgi:hypothetical protein